MKVRIIEREYMNEYAHRGRVRRDDAGMLVADADDGIAVDCLQWQALCACIWSIWELRREFQKIQVLLESQRNDVSCAYRRASFIMVTHKHDFTLVNVHGVRPRAHVPEYPEPDGLKYTVRGLFDVEHKHYHRVDEVLPFKVIHAARDLGRLSG